jgi:hypothetical protein
MSRIEGILYMKHCNALDVGATVSDEYAQGNKIINYYDIWVETAITMGLLSKGNRCVHSTWVRTVAL